MAKRVNAIRNIDNTTRLARGWRRGRPKVSVPSEDELFATKQQHSCGDCYRWSLTEAERRQWIDFRSPMLGALRVFSCGIFFL